VKTALIAGVTGEEPATEDTPQRPRSPYAVAKACLPALASWPTTNHRCALAGPARLSSATSTSGVTGVGRPTTCRRWRWCCRQTPPAHRGRSGLAIEANGAGDCGEDVWRWAVL